MNVQISGIAPREALEWPLRLSVGIVLLLIVAALPGVLFPGLYHDTPGIIASDRGSDLVTLSLFVPALAVSVFYSARGSLRGQMVWLGLVSFVLYNYVVYSFGISFTPLFLVHVALVSLSVFTLVTVIRKAETGTLTGQFSASMPHRVVVAALIVMAAMFSILWLSDVLPATIGGGIPARLSDLHATSNPVEVNDLGVIIPMLLLAALWTWQRRPVGYLMAGILFVVATATMTALIPGARLFGRTAVDPTSAGIAALSLALVLLVVSRAQPQQAGAGRVARIGGVRPRSI